MLSCDPVNKEIIIEKLQVASEIGHGGSVMKTIPAEFNYSLSLSAYDLQLVDLVGTLGTLLLQQV